MIAGATKLETIMRITSVAAAAALTLMTISTTLSAQGADVPIDPRSTVLLAQGKGAQAAGDLVRANDLMEAALAIDPHNRAAFIALAGVADAQKLPGKAIRYYREALTLEPNDTQALAGQGAVLVQRGALAKARENLAKIRIICKADCEPARTLAADIARGAPIVAQATPPAVKPPAVKP